ncbi:lipocalin family protein [Leeuwenhoekiella nanhaiensis]|uniref:Lipocalin-like domain-containing protein n=1 Tax=Leeuwenhoekiella nanhaiensis TaxID=1655491 RepID=A0A2G1VX21_9FLAO|nr:lipocalin family protein [Leeuwenhoekiella nanhaiensis]PHQ31322.1 hypothetical protein CJ305_03665 [Leeuwenhoekiella nanhaiensis]
MNLKSKLATVFKMGLLLHLLSLFLLMSCSSDDTQDDTETNPLIGVWQFERSQINDMDAFAAECPLYLTFTATEITEDEYFGSSCETLESFTYSYTYTDSKINAEETNGNTFILTVKEITKTKLITQTRESDSDVIITSYWYRKE